MPESKYDHVTVRLLQKMSLNFKEPYIEVVHCVNKALIKRTPVLRANTVRIMVWPVFATLFYLLPFS